MRQTGTALGGLGHPGLGKSAFHGYFTVISHTDLPLIPTPDWLVQDISVSAPGLAYGEPAPHLSSVVCRAQSLVRGPVTLRHPPGRHRPLSSGWVTSSSSTIMSQALRTRAHLPAEGPCQNPGLCRAFPQAVPPQQLCALRQLPPATLTCLWAPPTSLAPGASSRADPHPALQDRPLPSSLCPPCAHPAMAVPSPGVQPLADHDLSSLERATMQTPKKGLMTPSCGLAPLGPRLNLWGSPGVQASCLRFYLTVLRACKSTQTAHVRVSVPSPPWMEMSKQRLEVTTDSNESTVPVTTEEAQAS